MALPRDIDFQLDKSASPARMNRASTHIDARLRALETYRPAIEAIIAALSQIGLLRLDGQAGALADAFVPGEPGGVAQLDDLGRVPTEQLSLPPDFLGQVIAAWFASLPTELPGEPGRFWNMGGTLARTE